MQDVPPYITYLSIKFECWLLEGQMIRNKAQVPQVSRTWLATPPQKYPLKLDNILPLICFRLTLNIRVNEHAQRLLLQMCGDESHFVDFGA